jgi:probable HAF family extracellular repeat protein
MIRGTLGVSTAAALALSLLGCSRDTPLEPDSRPVDLGTAAASVVGNILDLGTLGGDEAVARGINSDGDIVGWVYEGGLSHPFIRLSGTVTHLSAGAAEDINDEDLVVGGTLGPPRIPAFTWHDGTQTELAHLSADPSCPSTSADAVNGSGQVVGESQNDACEGEAVLWDNGSVRGLGFLAEHFSRAWDINDKGQVVGYSSPHAFLWQNGSMQSLGTLGGDYSEAFGINSTGQVVGDSYVTEFGSAVHPFLWSSGHMTDLGTLGGPSAYARDINDNGQVVGRSETANGRMHAFWWENGVMSDLGTLGGDHMEANAINDRGQVVGQSNVTNRGPSHAVRWTIPTANYWSVRAALLPERRGHAVGVANGLLYAIGGENKFGHVISTVQAYNPATDSWSSKAPLPVGRQSANGAATINSTIYVAGGQNPAGTLTNTLYAYNATTNSWTTRANMPVPGGCGGSAVIAGKLYVFSGCRLVSGAQDAAGLLHRYDPGTNTWTTLRSAPAVHFQPVVAAIGGKLYVAGGNSGSGTAIRRLDVYDPANNSWATGAAMPTARVAMAGAVAGGKLYVVGGRSGTTYLDAVEAFDPVTGSWSRKAPMITPRAGLAAGAVGSFIFAVGGRNSHKLFVVNERYTP